MARITVSYQTLADGTFVDYGHQESGLLEVRGVNVNAEHPRRSFAFTLSLEEAREMALHLTGFIVTREAMDSPTRTP